MAGPAARGFSSVVLLASHDFAQGASLRSRQLFLDARQAAALAARVGAILMPETGCDPKTREFLALAEDYSTLPTQDA